MRRRLAQQAAPPRYHFAQCSSMALSPQSYWLFTSTLGPLHSRSSKSVPSPDKRITPLLRKAFPGALITNGGYDALTGEAVISRSEADLVSYGVPFLANPDLPERFRHETPLNPADFSTFYTGEEKGYTDYPALR